MKWIPLALPVVLTIVATACAGTGTYPFDPFKEMHYQQSHRVQEPPRLAPPSEAVPITGKERKITLEEARNLKNPLPATAETLRRGASLFRVDCAMCHGAKGRGDGPVGDFLVRDGYARPPDLTAAVTRARSDGEIFGIITLGVFVMPSFRNLLSPEERWALVHFIRSLQAEAGPLPAIPTPPPTADLVQRGRLAAERYGCLVCHSTTGERLVGPSWKGLFGKQVILADGSTVTADEEYLRESILEPGAKVVKDFPPVMPKVSLPQEDLEAIIAFIRSLK